LRDAQDQGDDHQQAFVLSGPAAVCVSAIANRSSHGPWSDDMKSKLGEQQPMMFTFYFK